MSFLPEAEPMLERTYGVKNGQVVAVQDVIRWFYNAQAPGGQQSGRAPGDRGAPGYDMTYCSPKSVSLLWGLSDDERVRRRMRRMTRQLLLRCSTWSRTLTILVVLIRLVPKR